MLGILLKKTLRELLSRYTYDRRSGKKRSKAGIVGMGLLVGFAFLSLIFSFAAMFFGLGIKILPDGYADAYFAAAGIFAAAMGVMGGALTAYSALFGAKDNDMLLAMPIKPGVIILSRVFSIYIMLVLWSGMVFLPALSIGALIGGLGIGTVLRGLAEYLALTLLLLAAACFLGWLIALLATRINSKKLLTVLSLVLVAGIYYFMYFQRNRIMNLTEDPDSAARKLKGFAPAYWFGSGIAGNTVNFLLFLALSLAAGGLAYVLISRSFIRMVTAKKGGRKKVYVEKALRVSGTDKTLLKRELKMFLSSPMYVVSGVLASVIMLALAVLAIVKGQALNGLLDRAAGSLGDGLSGRLRAVITALAPVLAGAMMSMNSITSLSISFEGRRLWISQTLPVEARRLFRAKVLVNVLFSGIPAVTVCAAAMAVLRADLFSILLGALYVAALTVLLSGLGLFVDMRWPLLDWTDENMVIKKLSSGLPVLIGWGISLVAAGIMCGLSFVLPGPVPYLAGATAAAAGMFFVVRGLGSPRTAEKFYTL